MKKITKLMILLVMCIYPVVAIAADYPDRVYPQKFWDVPKDHWAFTYVADLAERGVISGYEDGSFKPNGIVTRAEWAKMMVTAASVTVVESPTITFTDTKDHWSLKYIEAAKKYLSGYSDGSFKPAQAATREDVAMSMVKLKGYDLNEVDYSALMDFTDFQSISANMRPFICSAVMHGIITGYEDKTIRCQGTLTRAEAATILYKAYQLGDNTKSAEVTEADAAQNLAEPQPRTTQNLTESESLQDESIITSTDDQTVAELKSESLPYVIRKIADADINDNEYAYTVNGNSLYWIANNCIFCYNEDKQSYKPIFKLATLDIDNDIETLTDFEVYGISFNPSTQELYVQGRYKNINSAVATDGLWIYAIINDSNYRLVTDDYTGTFDGYFTRLIDEYEDYIVEEYALLTPSFEFISQFDNNDDYYTTRILDSTMDQNKLKVAVGLSSYAIDNHLAIAEYAKGELKTLSNFYPENTSIGINNTTVAVANSDTNTITLYNYNGKVLDKLSAENIDGIGFEGFKVDNIAVRMFIFDNDTLVLYNTLTKAFYAIEEAAN